jgi:hypothetical protein
LRLIQIILFIVITIVKISDNLLYSNDLSAVICAIHLRRTGQREISLADTADWQAGDDSHLLPLDGHLLSFSEGVLRTMAIRLLCDLRIMINDFWRPVDL